MKFGLGVLYKNLAKNEFRENRLSGNQILHKNFCIYFPCFLKFL